jgi:hypothetical protein
MTDTPSQPLSQADSQADNQTDSQSLDANPASRFALVSQLQADRLWLLRQIDSGRWSEWRLDLAALERELGQLLEQVEQIN